MHEYDDEVLNVFLKYQSKLFDENVADNLEEAEAFLEDCLAVVVNSLQEVWEYFDENGVDLEGMELEDIEDASEVFKIPDGRYLIVEG
ncbi:MAG: glyoxalase [bacterium]|nr:glyoxalase [bacterium]